MIYNQLMAENVQPRRNSIVRTFRIPIKVLMCTSVLVSSSVDDQWTQIT